MCRSCIMATLQTNEIESESQPTVGGKPAKYFPISDNNNMTSLESSVSNDLQNENQNYGTINNNEPNEPPKSKICWGTRHTFVLLAFLGTASAYAMRINLSVAIVAMVQQDNNSNSQMGTECPLINDSTSDRSKNRHLESKIFAWDAEQQGIILGAFYYGYVITQIPGGYLAEKYGGKMLFGLGTFITAFLTLLTPLAANSGVTAFITVRVLEGLGEGVTYPAMTSMISKWLPPKERSRFASIIWAGAQAGTCIAMPISGILADNLGWESVFYFFGTFGVIWFIFWTYFCHNSPASHPSILEDERIYIEYHIKNKNEGKTLPFPPLFEIFKTPAFWALILVHFGNNWGLYTLLNEMPTYLNNVQHYSLTANGFISALPYFLLWMFSMPVGIFADWLIAKEYFSLRSIRRICNSIGFFGPAIGLVFLSFAGCDRTQAIVWLCASVALNGAVYSGFQVNHMELSPNYAGTLFGITNMVANLTGFLTPYVAGVITNNNQTLDAWREVFLITAGIYFVMNTIFIIFIRTNIQPWNTYWMKKKSKK